MMQAYSSANPTCEERLKSHHSLATKICSFKLKGDRTRGFHETEEHIVHEEYFMDCLSS